MIKAYDDLGRVTTRTTTLAGTDYPSTYTYVSGGHGTGSTTGLISTISQYGQSWAYTYDDVGNITSEVHGGYTISYGYDNLGQLTRVNDERANETWTFDYDRGGNILSKSRYAYTTGTLGTALETIAYSYDASWKDKLASYNGIPVTYDAIGNPLTYGDWTYTWRAGRQLATMAATSITASFDYNANSLRIRKTVNGTATHYTLHGKRIVHLSQLTDYLHFFYDAQGRPSIVDFNGTRYSYIHNLQGDVVAIIDANGTPVVEYTYDAWGKPLSKTGTMANTLGALNPFRYRGYVYDEETGLYYLRSRYYNPVWGRFINADSVLGKPGQLLGHNLFAYCMNSPVGMSDSSGNMPNYRTMEADSGSTAGGGLIVGGILTALYYLFRSVSGTSIEHSQSQESTRKNNKSTIIYRWGSATYYNLTPRLKDTTGLSFSLLPPTNGTFVTTTIEAVNATGVLEAIKDGVIHVSVRPTNNSIAEWAATRENANINPHPLTLVLSDVIFDPFGR